MTLNIDQIASLADSEGPYRERIMVGLRGLSGPRLYELRRAADSTQPVTRRVVAEAIAGYPGSIALPILSKLAQDRELEVQEAAFHALSPFGEAALPALESGYERLASRLRLSTNDNGPQITAMETAASLGLAGAHFLIGMLRTEGGIKRKTLTEVIMSLGQEMVPILISHLDDPRGGVSKGCQAILARMADQSIEQVEEATRSNNPIIQKSAVRALEHFDRQQQRAVMTLVGIIDEIALDEKHHAGQPSWAKRALQQIVSFVSPWLPSKPYNETDEPVQGLAASALGFIASSPNVNSEKSASISFFAQGAMITFAVPALLRQLRSVCSVENPSKDDKSIRYSTEYALKMIGIEERGSTVRVALEELVKDPNPTLRAVALDILEGIAQKINSMRRPDYDSPFDRTDRTSSGLAKTEEKYQRILLAAPLIVPCLRDSDSRVQFAAIKALTPFKITLPSCEEEVVEIAKNAASDVLAAAAIDYLNLHDSTHPELHEVLLRRLNPEEDVCTLIATLNLAARLSKGNSKVLMHITDLLGTHKEARNYWVANALRRAVFAIDPDGQLLAQGL